MSSSEKRCANILIAYPYFDSDIYRALRSAPGAVRLLVDSGAFTAWKAGRTIELDDYCRFLESLPVTPWRYFTLDVIGDPAATLRNYDTMLARGFNPIPIFTRGDRPDVLERYYASADVVGIGSGVGTPKRKGFINGVMRLAGTRRVHWLGFTNMDYLKHYRPYMCDSSSWESGARYGQFSLYMGRGRSITYNREKFAQCRDEVVFARIREFGLEPGELLRRDAWHGGPSVNRRICAASGLRFQFDLEDNLDTLMFNALTTGYALRLFLDALDHAEGHPNARAA